MKQAFLRVSRFSVLALFIGVLTVPLPASAVAAGSATVTITAKLSSGAVVSGQQISCVVTPPSSVPPVPPTFNYLKTSASGVAVWNVSLMSGATYNCYPQTALTPDNCYGWAGASTGTLNLTDGQSVSFTFTAAAEKSSACNTTLPTETQLTQRTPQTTTQTTQNTSAPEPTVPAAPSLNEVKLDGKVVTAGTSPKVKVGQPLVLSGTASPGSTVVVTVHSDPVTAKVTAGADGTWSFDLASLKTLPVGKHSVEVSALDTASGKESPKVAVLSYELIAAATTSTIKQAAPAVAPSDGRGSVGLYAAIIAGLLLLGALAGWLVRKNRRPTTLATEPEQSSIPEPAAPAESSEPANTPPKN
jgi:hypothetical protein